MTPAIPRGPDDLTPSWLGAVLGGATPVAVDRVVVTPVGTGQTGATYRLTVDYPAPAGHPRTLVAKLPAQDDAVRAGVTLGYLAEVEFYAGVAHRTSVPVPRCHHSAINRDGSEYVLLLDDLDPAQQGDQVSGCDEETARRAVTALAGLHGPSWCDPAWLALPVGAMPKPGDVAAAGGLGQVVDMVAPAILERFGPFLDDADRETLRRALELMGPWLCTDTGRYALMHGDYRLDNLLFDADRLFVVDWQTLGVGLPARDLAYFIGTCLDPELRAATEQRLVAAYHAELLRHGVRDYDLETCLADYRLGMLQGPLIIALGAAFAASTERGDDLFRVMLRRSCRAIRELGTLDLVRAAGATA
ncbi:phosphotransferase family protein [Nocardia asteroides]|uniref:phosphotransferase family protein n=1 Tax=Nocardia asteroides TaxID=1824 RepID=UPI001E3CDE4F|nr:ecdysteroid 22-kinase family protein [Nocardia asteroides]UGT62551.1 ecdysteroid 22-kinase family protein [Nocardia asteroides]